MSDETVYMKRTLDLAANGLGRTFPNPLVGAVIVSGGEIVGEGFHGKAGGPHAEVEAIRSAGDRSRGSTLYINLEPCCHHGKTPPCTDAILESGIERVVIAIKDPDSRVMGRGVGILRENGVDVKTGVLDEEAVELNLPYLHKAMTGRPFIVLKLAMTLDGRLAVPQGGWFTGDESRESVHRLRTTMEAIAVGSGTLAADLPLLDRRYFRDAPGPPIRMVFDSSLSSDIPVQWKPGENRVIFYCTERATEEMRKEFEDNGVEVVLLPEDRTGIDLKAWVEHVSTAEISSVLIEGGRRIASSVAGSALFDRFIVYHAPILDGGPNDYWTGPDMYPDGEGDRLILGSSRTIGQDVLSIYDRERITGYRLLLSENDLMEERRCLPD
ncbi:MAG: bifunctional diaminohydroxyphosphoribosylaminopyrimidine deaminase/5-amino-6-(5-phosphoribosylamino)uracil reductase RibD [Bacteroidales bacterium]|nr:bifunctional diaminohydroxyphosphoribosylaminopyrimidine deaminase/5-amino-6-(5-phosphoribosylamino)uracil reductase RibD [Candidatus Latescibacterota bacterium]